MPITIKDAINLLPSSIRDNRGQYFIRIVFWFCCEPEHLTLADFPLSLIPYKLKQFGLGQIAGLASRLSAASQRQLLAEASTLQKLAGTPRSIKRLLEIFGHTGAVIEENPTINGVKRWGEFGVVVQQPFNYAEIETIINALKPPSRKVIYIRFVNALQLDGSQALNGLSILEGLAGPEAPPTQWQDATTALNPVAALTPIPDFTSATTNNATTVFNPQLQAFINQITFEDSALSSLANRVNVLNSRLAELGGGSIAPQLALINSGLTTLINSNQMLLNTINQVTTPINNLTTKANSLELQTNTITTESNARQLDSTVQRRNPTLDAIAALNPIGSTNRVFSTTGTNNAPVLEIAPTLSAFIPQVANLEFRQPPGTNAGNYPTADVWVAMPFTVISNENNFLVILSASRFRIPKGTYLVTYNWQGCGCLGFGGRIWNVGNSTAIEQGSPGLTVTGGGNIGDTWSAEGCLLAVVSVTGNTDIEFQFRAKALHPSGAGLTAGQSTSNATEQIYQEAVILRLAD